MSLFKSQSERSYQDGSLGGESSHTDHTDTVTDRQMENPTPTPSKSRPAREKRNPNILSEDMGYIFYDATSIPEELRSPKQAKVTPQARSQGQGTPQTEIHKLPIWEIPPGWNEDLTNIPSGHRLSDNAVGRICFLYPAPSAVHQHLRTDFYYDGTLHQQRMKCGLPFLDSEGAAMRVRGHLLCGKDRVRSGPYTEKNWQSMNMAQEWRSNPGFAIAVPEADQQDQAMEESETTRQKAGGREDGENMLLCTEPTDRAVDGDFSQFNIQDDAYCWKALRVLVAREPQHKACGARQALLAREQWLRSRLADVVGSAGPEHKEVMPSIEAETPLGAFNVGGRLKYKVKRLKGKLQVAETVAKEKQAHLNVAHAMSNAMIGYFLQEFQCDLNNIGDRAARYIAISGGQKEDIKAKLADAGYGFLERLIGNGKLEEVRPLVKGAEESSQ